MGGRLHRADGRIVLAAILDLAGESVAAGVVFTVPALIFFGERGSGYFNYFQITMLAFAGGILGVLMMVPLRRALIVKEHGVLPYPEGTACADVLVAGERGGALAKTVFMGLGVGAFWKALSWIVQVFPHAIGKSLGRTGVLPKRLRVNPRETSRSML